MSGEPTGEKNLRQSEAPQVEITQARPEDERDIARVQYESSIATLINKELGITADDIKDQYKDYFQEDGAFSADGEQKIAKTVQRLKDNPPTDSQVFVAKEAGKIIGFCTVNRGAERNQIVGIYVLPGNQGKGIGPRLWASAQQFIDPNKETSVALFSHNSQAKEFYRKIGFEETGVVREGAKMKSGVSTTVIEMLRKA